MIIMGIDPALKKCGVATLTFGESNRNYSHNCKVDTESIGDEIITIAPNVVVVEDQFNMRLKELVGYIRGIAYSVPGCVAIKVQSRTWKSWLDPDFPRMKKNTKKLIEQYLADIHNRVGFWFPSTDEADAYCMAKFVQSCIGYAGKQPTYRRIAEELKGVKS